LAARIATLEAELEPGAARFDAGYAHWLATAADAARAAVAQPPGLIASFPFDAPHPVIEPPKVDPKKPPPAVKPPAVKKEPPAVEKPPAVKKPPRRRRRPPDEDRARQSRRRAAAGRRQLHRGRQEGRVLRGRNEPPGQLRIRVDRAAILAPAHLLGAVMNGLRYASLRADGTLTPACTTSRPTTREIETTTPV
jgi:hypothetical protein